MKLYNGDCLEVMKLIPDKSIDAIITDPPSGTTQCIWDSVIPFEPMWERDPNFSHALLDAYKAGVKVWCISLNISKTEITFNKEIPVNFGKR